MFDMTPPAACYGAWQQQQYREGAPPPPPSAPPHQQQFPSCAFSRSRRPFYSHRSAGQSAASLGVVSAAVFVVHGSRRAFVA